MIFSFTDFKNLCDNYRIGYFEEEFQKASYYEIIFSGDSVMVREGDTLRPNWSSCRYFPFGEYLFNTLKGN